MPFGHQIWSQELLTKVLHITEVKDHAGVSLGQIEVKLLKNILATKFSLKVYTTITHSTDFLQTLRSLPAGLSS